MAPEQARGLPADARSDIFAFGVVLYEMLAGRRAFAGDTASDTLAALLTKDPEPLPPVTPPGLDRVVRRCLEKRPEDRFQSAHDLSLALEVAASSPAPLPPPPRSEASGARPRLWPRWAVAAVVVLLVAAAALAVWRWKGRASYGAPPQQAQTIKALAVFPLDDLSGDAAQSYFAPSMTDALNTKLTQIKSLKVIGQVSAEKCKQDKMPLPKVADVLGVDAVVTGTVLRVGDTVRISVRLLDARTDANLWAESYERKLSDVLALQGEVAQAIAASVRATVSPEEKAKLAGRPVDPRAYEEYLAGLYDSHQAFWENATLLAAISHLKKAVELDPNFSAAYAQLAQCYLAQWFFGFLTYERAHPLAREATLKAVEAAPSDPASHVALYNLRLNWERDLPGAEREVRKAMELDANAPTVLAAHGQLMAMLGRDAEAMEALRKALELDPVNPDLWARLREAHFMAGRWGDGFLCDQKMAELTPVSSLNKSATGLFYAARGERQKALAHATKARNIHDWDKQYVTVSNLAILYAMLGQREEATKMLRSREPLCIGNQAEEMDLGLLSAWLGERDRAFQHFEKGCSMPGAVAYQVGSWYVFPREFLADPRYKALVLKLGLPLIEGK